MDGVTDDDRKKEREDRLLGAIRDNVVASWGEEVLLTRGIYVVEGFDSDGVRFSTHGEFGDVGIWADVLGMVETLRISFDEAYRSYVRDRSRDDEA